MLADLKQLTIDYTKQETLEPLKGLGRYIGAGLAGSLLLGIGLTLWMVALLRALQEETGTALTGHLTWVPYLLTLVVVSVIAAMAAFAITKEKRNSEKRKAERRAEAAQASSATASGNSASGTPTSRSAS